MVAAFHPRSPAALVPGSASTAELIILVARGDQVAYAQLYATQLPWIRSFAYSLLRDFHQAEEVAQEVLLQIWQIANRFEPARGSAVAWIRQISRARTVDHIRHSQASKVRDARHAEGDWSRDFDGVVETVLAQLDINIVRNGLLMVTALQREALVLAFFTDQTYDEIAHDLHVPLGTLKTRVRDGLMAMRRSLGCLSDRTATAA